MGVPSVFHHQPYIDLFKVEVFENQQNDEGEPRKGHQADSRERMAPGKPDRSWHHRVDALVAGGPAAPYHREAPSASHHRAAPSLDFLKSLKSITVADVKADRALRESLRRLRASVLEAHPATGDSEFRATRPPPLIFERVLS